jgi:hypothetical protein
VTSVIGSTFNVRNQSVATTLPAIGWTPQALWNAQRRSRQP